MPQAGTVLSGPLQTGTKKDADTNGPSNLGLCVLSQQVTLTQNGASNVTGQIVLPVGSRIVQIYADTTVAWNSGTSDTLSVGATAGGTDYASSISVAVAGRAAITYTAAELVAMQSVGSNTSVYATVTPVGTAATTGSTTVTIEYVQTVQPTAGIV